MKKTKTSIFRAAIAGVVSAALLLLGARAVLAQLTNAHSAATTIAVAQGSAWGRLLPNGIAAGYLTLNNPSAKPVELISVTSPKAYEHVALHESILAEGLSHMRTIKTLSIPAHSQVALAPGSYHLMLLKPMRKIKVGDDITLVLTFSNGEILEVIMPMHNAIGRAAGTH